MKMFSINSKATWTKSAAILCAAVMLGGCAPQHSATDEAPLRSSEFHSESPEETTSAPVVETGVTVPEIEETVDMSSMMEEASISVISQEGTIGEFDFFTCNETQLFGDYSISLASYDGEEYLMLSYNGIALLAKEDGSDAMLFYNDQRLDLPFPCYFNLDYEFLALHEGDFLGSGTRQLALIIPMETGSGIDVDQLQIVDLDTMSIVPLHTHEDDYEEEVYSLFEEHFAQVGMTRDYFLFQYVQYSIHDGLIFVEYGACDEDSNYLSFLQGSLTADNGVMVLNPAMSFHDELY